MSVGGGSHAPLVARLVCTHPHPPPSPCSVTVAEVYSALRSVTVNDEVCRQVDAAGGIDTITSALSQHTSERIVVTSAALGLSGPSTQGLITGAEAAAVFGGLGLITEEEGSVGEGADPTLVGEGSIADGGSVTGDPLEVVSAAGSAGSAAGAAGVVAAALSAAASAAASGTETSVQRRIRMLRCGLAVLRTLANSDPNKVKMGEGRTLPLLLQVLETAADVPPLLDQAIAALANLCLRLPANAVRVYDAGALPLIARAMRRHPGYMPLQRSCCLALRNVIARAPERIQASFDEGFEGLLQGAYVRHVPCRDVAYASLRDMGCAYAETSIGRAQADRAARAIASNNIRVE